jgi:FkbM family methyltransferase
LKLDREWLLSQANDTETANKLYDIINWQKQILSDNRFPTDEAPFYLSLNGLTLKYHPYSAVASLEIYQEIFRDNDHRILEDFVGNNSSVLLDVGANQGMYALRAKLENPDCKVYCFEPSPNEYQTLLDNIRLNNLKNIDARNLAIGESDTIINFEYVQNVGAISGLGIRTVKRHWMREEFISSQRIKQTTLDAFCESANISHIDILKIDTEGMEIDVLQGGRNTLLISDRVVIERHSPELRHSVAQFMDNASYELVYETDELLKRYYADMYFVNTRLNGKE